ncbi:MAG: prolipoprotein diacylglyceryl transferase [Candidatus Babeliaceae bacterium]|nr:prolipoprotein diacylglyceryl transferase [Candidatus Babeliaceae bacterium]
MNPILCNFFWVFPIPLYGFCIVLGVAAALFLAWRDNRVSALMSRDDLCSLGSIAIIGGIVGGRVLFLLTTQKYCHSWYEIFAVWDGGFAILGTVVGSVLMMTWFIKKKGLPLLKVFDVLGMYAPLIQAFGRVGCFFAGCCFGVESSCRLAITYTHPLSMAPLCIPLHPVQLYNAVLLGVLFLILYSKPPLRIAGLTFCLSLAGLIIIRFATDFWRGDRGILTCFMGVDLSVHQIISLGLIVLLAFFALFLIVVNRKRG